MGESLSSACSSRVLSLSAMQLFSLSFARLDFEWNCLARTNKWKNIVSTCVCSMKDKAERISMIPIPTTTLPCRRRRSRRISVSTITRRRNGSSCTVNQPCPRKTLFFLLRSNESILHFSYLFNTRCSSLFNLSHRLIIKITLSLISSACVDLFV